MANVPFQGKPSTNMDDNRVGSTSTNETIGFGDTDPPSAGGVADDRDIRGAEKDLMSRASDKLLDTAEQQKTAGANFVGNMAGAVRRAAGEFDGQIPQAADYIRYAADQMENMSDAVRRRDVGQIVSELQYFARQQPTAFLGATFLAGFAAVRFLKSSSSSAASSSAAMRAPRPSSGMARYGNYGGRSTDTSMPPSDL